MTHFGYLDHAQREALFAVPPRPFGPQSPRDVLALALGATLYSPGTRPTLAVDARRAASIGATSMVWDLEDSVAHEQVPQALRNVAEQLQALVDEPAPLLFVRVRTPAQLDELAAAAGTALRRLSGFVMPKFEPGEPGEQWFAALARAEERSGQVLYGMPVLEHPDLAWHETRRAHLDALRVQLAAHRERVLAVRVGGTDLCGLFGLRRDSDTTLWEVAVVRDALGDALNTFARCGEHVVTGPVWEHFASPERLFRSRLRSTPFERRRMSRLRDRMLRDDVDVLLREVALDRANGFTGKTVIHPTHVSVVNALLCVTREEYDDAQTVLARREHGGVVASPSGGKMNEIGPHTLWAEQVAARAGVYGVLGSHDGVVELLDAGWRAVQQAYPTLATLPTAGRGVSRTDLSSVVEQGLGLRWDVSGDPYPLAGLALRENPKRAQLVVSRVLAKHLPVTGSAAERAGHALGDRVATLLGEGPPAVVLGYCETATALGQLVAERLPGADYVHTTRRPEPDVPVLGGFEEEHSHATGHVLQPRDPGPLWDPARPLVLVDDELTSGTTVRNTLAALPHHDRVLVATLLDLRPAASRAADLQVLATLHGELVVPGDVHERAAVLRAALAHAAPAPEDPGPGPAGEVVVHRDLWPAGVATTGRTGLTEQQRAAQAQATAALARVLAPLLAGRTLVLGTEELLRVPIGLAALLGERAVVHSTTRSPVTVADLDGYPVRRALLFPAPDDPTRTSRLHGLPEQPYDDVVVLVDAPGWAPLAHALRPWGRVHVVEL